MRLAGAVVGRRYQAVELATQIAQLAMHRRRRMRRSLGDGGPLSQLLVLAAVQQGAHLVGIEQAWDTKVVRFLVASGRGGGAERRPVEDDLIEFRVGSQ